MNLASSARALEGLQIKNKAWCVGCQSTVSLNGAELQLLCESKSSRRRMSVKKLEVINKTNGRSNLLSITTLQTEVICNVVLQLSQTQFLLHVSNQDDVDVEAEFLLNLEEEETISGYEIDVNGLMVPAVVVPKEKARVAFETEVREKASGPSIVEHVAGNVFKIRIYPIKALSKRIIKITFVRSLENNQYKLELHSPQNGVINMSCKFQVTAPQSGEFPKITTSNFGPSFQLKQKSGTKDTRYFEALYETASYSSVGNSLMNLACTFAKQEESCAIVETDNQQLQYFCINDIQPNYSTKSDLAISDVKTVGLFWDCSLSRLGTDKGIQLQVLKVLLERLKDVVVELSVFSNQVHLTRSFKITNGKYDDLLQTIQSVDYDGATNLNCLTFKEAGFHLLFSDGIATLGSEPTVLSSPVYCFASEDQFDHNMLKTIAFQSGGEFFNLKKISASEIPSMIVSRIISSPFSFISHEASDERFIYDVFPCVPTAIQTNKFFICGKIRSTATVPIKLTLNFGYASKITQQKTFILTPISTSSEEDAEIEAEADSSGLLPRYWAQKKINHLMLYPETDSIIQQIEEVGKQYNIVTKTTSFIVLETLDQYLKYCIEPPKSLAAIRKEYFLRINQKKAQDKQRFDQKLGNVFDLWSRRVTWWDSEYLQKTWQPVIVHFKHPSTESQFEKSIERWYRQTEHEKYEQIRIELEHKEAELKSKNASMEVNREVLVQSLQSNITQWDWQTKSVVMVHDGKLILKINLAYEADINVVNSRVKEFLSDRLPSRFHQVVTNMHLRIVEEDLSSQENVSQNAESFSQATPFSEYGLDSGVIFLIKSQMEAKMSSTVSTLRRTHQERELSEDEKIQAFVDISHETQKLMEMTEQEMRKAVEMDSLEHIKDETAELDYMVERELIFGLDSIKEAMKDIQNRTELEIKEPMVDFLKGTQTMLVAFQTQVIKQPELFKSKADWSKGMASVAARLTKSIRGLPDSVVSTDREATTSALKSVVASALAFFSESRKQTVESEIAQKMSHGVKQMSTSSQTIVVLLQMAAARFEEGEIRATESIEESPKKDVEQQVQILKLQKELEKERTRLGSLRKAVYLETATTTTASPQPAVPKSPVPRSPTVQPAPPRFISGPSNGLKLFGKAKPKAPPQKKMNTESVDGLMDDIQESMNVAMEISQAISLPMEKHREEEDEELLMELDALEQETVEELLTPLLPPVSFESKIAVWDEAAELLDLERSMMEPQPVIEFTKIVEHSALAVSPELKKKKSGKKLAGVEEAKGMGGKAPPKVEPPASRLPLAAMTTLTAKPMPAMSPSYGAVPPRVMPTATPTVTLPAKYPATPPSAPVVTGPLPVLAIARAVEESEAIGAQTWSLLRRQQEMIDQQDKALDMIEESVSRQRQLSQNISTELDDHHKLLDDISMETDSFDSRGGGSLSFFGALKQLPNVLGQLRVGQDLTRIKFQPDHAPLRRKTHISKVQMEVDEVKDVIHKNIGIAASVYTLIFKDQILARGESIDCLMSKSEDLSHQSLRFIKSARSLKRQMWRKNCRVVSLGVIPLLLLILGFYFLGWSFLVVLLCLAIGGAASLRAFIWTDSNRSSVYQESVYQYCPVCGEGFSHSHTCPALLIHHNSQQAVQFIPQQLIVTRKENPLDQMGNQMNYYWRMKTQKKLTQITDSEIDLSDVSLDQIDTPVTGFYAGTTYNLNHHTDLRVLVHKIKIPSNLPATQQYRQYLQKRTKGSHPSLFVSVADSIFEADRSLAWTVLSNVVGMLLGFQAIYRIELELDNQQHYRLVGYKLEEYGFYDESGLVFQRLLKIRGEEPQSFRDYAMALTRQKKYQQAVNHLVTVIEKMWDVRFEQIGMREW